MKYYAVKKGHKVGIFNTWEECKNNVEGYKGATYKSFSSLKKAEEYLSADSEEESLSRPTAYIDGSFNGNNDEYSFGGLFIVDGTITTFNKKYPADIFSVHRNIAGEIKGAGYVIQYAINHQIKELDLYYDYLGIEKWFTGEWKASSVIAVKYVEFAHSVKDKVKIYFHKVKSHTNDKYNDMADYLAKQALGLIV